MNSQHKGTPEALPGKARRSHRGSQRQGPPAPRSRRSATRSARPSVIACCLALLVGPACSGKPSGELVCGELRFGGRPPDTSLVLIVNDAMRPDRLGVYGGSAHTPAFDAFARANLLFDRAYSQSPWTKPSMATLFTSLYPSQHGALMHSHYRHSNQSGEELQEPVLESDVLSAELTTLAEVLRGAGFRTAAFVGNPWIERRFGFDQGFQVYDDSFASWDVPGERVSRAGLEWLAGFESGERFFLYLHFMDSHRPYGRLTQAEIRERAAELRADRRPLGPAARQAIAKLVYMEDGTPAVSGDIPASVTLLEMAYDRGIENFDRALAEFLEGFAAHEAYSRTALIVTSDHGEALFTRGYGNHGTGLYDDEMAIPLVARLPGVTAATSPIMCRVGLIDLMPTICSYLGLDCPEPLVGLSLLEHTRTGAELRDRYLVAEGVLSKLQNRAIRNESHKLLWQPQRGPDNKIYALFDLRRDPGEMRDLLGSKPRSESTQRIVSTLMRAARVAVPEIEAPRKESITLDAKREERLRALGYLD